jgi:hypothetical protein
MWDSITEVLETVDKDIRGSSPAARLLEKMKSFEFVFIIKLMLKLFAITNELSHILQRKKMKYSSCYGANPRCESSIRHIEGEWLG